MKICQTLLIRGARIFFHPRVHRTTIATFALANATLCLAPLAINNRFGARHAIARFAGILQTIIARSFRIAKLAFLNVNSVTKDLLSKNNPMRFRQWNIRNQTSLNMNFFSFWALLFLGRNITQLRRCTNSDPFYFFLKKMQIVETESCESSSSPKASTSSEKEKKSSPRRS